MKRDFEYDEYGRKFTRIKTRCQKCDEHCFKAVQTLKNTGYEIEITNVKPQSEFKRVRDVTHEEHGITKPYKGVYACIVCGDEQVMDNQIEKGKQYE